MAQKSIGHLQAGNHIYIEGQQLEPEKVVSSGPIVATVIRNEHVTTFRYQMTLTLHPDGEQVKTKEFDLQTEFSLFE